MVHLGTRRESHSALVRISVYKVLATTLVSHRQLRARHTVGANLLSLKTKVCHVVSCAAFTLHGVNVSSVLFLIGFCALSASGLRRPSRLALRRGPEVLFHGGCYIGGELTAAPRVELFFSPTH